MNEVVFWFFEGIVIAGFVILLVEIMEKRKKVKQHKPKVCVQRKGNAFAMKKEVLVCCNGKCLIYDTEKPSFSDARKSKDLLGDDKV